MSSFASGPTITLISSDDESFEVSVEVAKMSSYVLGFIEVNPDERTLSVPLVTGSILRKVIEFCEHSQTERMKEIPKPLPKQEFSEIVQPFFASFVGSLTPVELRDLSRAANFMGVAPLLSLCTAKIASFIRNKSVEEIRANLGLSMAFSAEEDARLRAENAWCTLYKYDIGQRLQNVKLDGPCSEVLIRELSQVHELAYKMQEPHT